MKMRFMGNTGIKVSEVCFGAMTFGGKSYSAVIGEVGQKEAAVWVSQALEGGISFLRLLALHRMAGRIEIVPRYN